MSGAGVPTEAEEAQEAEPHQHDGGGLRSGQRRDADERVMRGERVFGGYPAHGAGFQVEQRKVRIGYQPERAAEAARQAEAEAAERAREADILRQQADLEAAREAQRRAAEAAEEAARAQAEEAAAQAAAREAQAQVINSARDEDDRLAQAFERMGNED